MKKLLFFALLLLATDCFAFTQTSTQPPGEMTLAVGRSGCSYPSHPYNGGYYFDPNVDGQTIYITSNEADYVWLYKNIEWCGVGSKYAVEQYHFVPAPAEPATCTNGFLDGDEEYADCGGSCVASCVESCPSGYTYFEELGACADASRFTLVPSGYDCPPSYGFDPDGNGSTQCIHMIPVQFAPESAPLPDSPDYIQPYSEPSLTAFTGSNTTTVDNGDGTSTSTTVSDTSTQATNGTILKETTTTVSIYNTATGQILSASISSESATSDNSEPSDVGLPVVPDSLSNVVRVDGSSITFQPIKDASDGLMVRFPFSVITHFENFLDTWVVEPVAPSFDLPMEMIRQEPYQVSLSMLDPLAVWFRSLLGFLSYISGGWMIIRTWRG